MASAGENFTRDIVECTLLQFGETIVEKKDNDIRHCSVKLEKFLLMIRSNVSCLANSAAWEGLLHKMEHNNQVLANESGHGAILELTMLIREQVFMSNLGSILNWKQLLQGSQSVECRQKLFLLLESDFTNCQINATVLQKEWKGLLSSLSPINPVKLVLKMPSSLAAIQILQCLLADNETIFVQAHAAGSKFPLYEALLFALETFLVLVKSSSTNLLFVFQFDVIISKMLISCFSTFRKTPIPIVIANQFAQENFCLANVVLFFPNSYRISQQILRCLERRLADGIEGVKLSRGKSKLSNGIELSSIATVCCKKSKILLTLANGKVEEIPGGNNRLLFDSLRTAAGLVTEATELFPNAAIFKALLFDLFYDRWTPGNCSNNFAEILTTELQIK